MNYFLCDTNIISEEMRPRPNSNVRAWLQQQERIHISTITIDEIFFGLHFRKMKRRMSWFEQFIEDSCIVLTVDTRIAQRSGSIRAELGKMGQTREQADMLIAATAWAHGLTLATRNTRDFEGAGIPVFNPFEAV